MLSFLLATSNGTGDLEVVLALLAVIVVAIAAILIFTWEKAPWWRTAPTERRQLQIDKDLVKIYKIKKRYPEVFAQPPQVLEKDSK